MEIDSAIPAAPPAAPVAAPASAPAAATKYELPWVEKYRPTQLADIVGNEAVMARLGVIARDGNMPNLLLAGAPGVGKTTAVLALARQSLGGDAALLREAVLELNASDDRGIETVRSAIKSFAQKKLTLPPGRHKLVLLDEADSMTEAAQQALRRTMEVYSSTTRFALACNLSGRIIEPIQSRCAVVRFARLTDAQVLARVRSVAAAEDVTMDDEGAAAVVFTADGDMRVALNGLQATVNGFGAVTKAAVLKVCDVPHPGMAKEILDAAVARDVDAATAVLMRLVRGGYAPVDIVQVLFRVTKVAELPEAVKLDVLRAIGLTHARLAGGVASTAQLCGLVARMCRIGL
ncbi:hypothetical protein I4F81_008863 [Pyropia yezoensis]|uniref:Uncharacterized protein n=1 Tax=Pyropia yezoensis TaxID=2788 RepID=A0ACC3C998_PYRYE|nr:hypothetical protein I4F81_008863 [Neopyropia yezoensis]|eukprot:contig_4045_g886